MINKKSIKILVCCHKQDVMATQDPYMPIHVGKALHPEIDLGIQGDNTGDNISEKNGSYCELTGMYWAWKSLKDVDIIGLCHYRRYFDFHGQVPSWSPNSEFIASKISALDLSVPQNVISKIDRGVAYIANPIVFRYALAIDYCNKHISDDFRVLEQIVNSTQPEYIRNAFRFIMHQNNKLSPCNMFLMTKIDFDNYCEWLFGILSNVEEKIDISHYNDFQYRIYGFMAERLFNVYLYANHFKTHHLPIIFLKDRDINNSTSYIKYMQRCLRYNLGMFISSQKRFE